METVWNAKSCHVCIDSYLFSEEYLFAVYSFLLLQKELVMLHFVCSLSWDAKWKIMFILKMDIQGIITAFEEISKYPFEICILQPKSQNSTA